MYRVKQSPLWFLIVAVGWQLLTQPIFDRRLDIQESGLLAKDVQSETDQTDT